MHAGLLAAQTGPKEEGKEAAKEGDTCTHTLLAVQAGPAHAHRALLHKHELPVSERGKR